MKNGGRHLFPSAHTGDAMSYDPATEATTGAWQIVRQFLDENEGELLARLTAHYRDRLEAAVRTARKELLNDDGIPPLF